ncbi:MAG TPA: hypothetical protein VGH42_08460 [Verrucomicrobiae bacterium]
MSTIKTKTPPNGATDATASNEPNHRINPEVETKIDNWIEDNPKDWNYIKGLPIDRLRRMVILNDLRKTAAIERIDQETLKAVNDDPKRKQSYDIQTEGMSAEQRDEYIIKAERERRRIKQQSQDQTQSRKEGVGVGV